MKRLLIPALVVLAGCGTDVSGPSTALLACVYGDPAHLDVGGVTQLRGAALEGVCLDGGGDGSAEYLYVPFFSTADTARTLSFDVTGAGVADVVGAGESQVRIGRESALERPGYVRSFALDHWIRRREIEELGPKIRPGAPVSATVFADAPAADVPQMGEPREFNVAISCSDTDHRTGRVMYVSDHAVVYADTANPADLTPDDYRYFGVTFDTLVHRVVTGHFGAPTDIDNNDRAILFFTRAVNERNSHDASSVTVGFFWSGDLFPEEATSRLQACPASNHSEMFYLIAPDPQGVAGAAFTLEEVRNLAIPLIGHEFQHLINASRRLFVNNASTFEAPWLNEGLSHISEELLYFDVSGLGTGRNLTVDSVRNARAPADTLFNRYMGSNFNNFAKFLTRPDTSSLMGPANALTTRGAVWNFLRYASDRTAISDTVFFRDLVNGTLAGIENLDDALAGDDALEWMRDWAVSVYADDHVPGIESRFTNSSWNLRSLYEGSTLQRYPLRVELIEDNEIVEVDLDAGGTLFGRFGVTSDGRAAIHVGADGGVPATLYGSFLRVR